MRPRIIVLPLLLAIVGTATLSADSVSDLKQSIVGVLNRAPSNEAGAEVLSVKRGDVLFARNPHKPFLPASNTKLITSATALEMLGADHQFSTGVYVATDSGVGGIVDGDIILRGSADPSLSNRYIAQLAQEVQKAGVRRVNGRILATGPVGSGDIGLSAAETAHQFYARLGDVGILVNGKWGATKGVPKGALKLCGRNSRTVRETIRLMNKPSDNEIADSLMRALIIHVGAQKQRPLDFVTHFWQQRGVDVTGVRFYDGSGLSRGNRVTPAFLVGLLRYMRDESHNAAAFRDSLPIAACDGTLARRMHDTCAANNVRAKTGFLTGVCTLSGYVSTRDGEPLVFSFLFNNFDCDANVFRHLQDQMCERLAGFRR